MTYQGPTKVTYSDQFKDRGTLLECSSFLTPEASTAYNHLATHTVKSQNTPWAEPKTSPNASLLSLALQRHCAARKQGKIPTVESASSLVPTSTSSAAPLQNLVMPSVQPFEVEQAEGSYKITPSATELL